MIKKLRNDIIPITTLLRVIMKNRPRKHPVDPGTKQPRQSANSDFNKILHRQDKRMNLEIFS